VGELLNIFVSCLSSKDEKINNLYKSIPITGHKEQNTINWIILEEVKTFTLL
jgi:hypothetical protein